MGGPVSKSLVLSPTDSCIMTVEFVFFILSFGLVDRDRGWKPRRPLLYAATLTAAAKMHSVVFAQN